MSMTRKEFCGGLAGATVLLLIQGCGGGGGYSGTSLGGGMTSTTTTTATSCGAAGSAISNNHGHMLAIARSDLDSLTDKVYSIMGTATHDHTVTLTAAMLAQLKIGLTVVVTSSVTTDAVLGAHSHTVSVTCM